MARRQAHATSPESTLRRYALQAVILLLALSMTGPPWLSRAWSAETATALAVIQVRATDVATSSDVTRLVQDVRARADAFVFLSGGASRMSPEARGRVLVLLDALALLARRGIRFAVGDGGTQAGLMEAAGLVRRVTGGAFPLIGVAPAPDVTVSGEAGKAPVDPNHSHVITVENPAWAETRRAEGWKPEDGSWGSETVAMYTIFDRLAAGRPSVALVANGGAITLDEVRENLARRRSIVVVAGSGRAADAIVALLDGTTPNEEETQRLWARAAALDVPAHRDLFRVIRLEDGPLALAEVLEDILRRP
jgi:hypothetical protein